MDFSSHPQSHVGITVPQQRRPITINPRAPDFPSNPNLPFISFDIPVASSSSSISYGLPPPLPSHGGAAFGSFEEEPPLLEELGINTHLIMKKTLNILNPIRVNSDLHEDADLSGPFVLCMMMGLFQLLAGKLQFGVILGWICMASFFLYVVFNMLAGRDGNLDLYRCLSMVGYSMVPMVVFSALSLVVPHRGIGTFIMAGLTVLWCTRASTNLLVVLAPHAVQHRSLVDTSLSIDSTYETPRALLNEEEVVLVQASVQEHRTNIEDQANDPMEEDNDDDNIVEDGTNRLI